MHGIARRARRATMLWTLVFAFAGCVSYGPEIRHYFDGLFRD